MLRKLTQEKHRFKTSLGHILGPCLKTKQKLKEKKKHMRNGRKEEIRGEKEKGGEGERREEGRGEKEGEKEGTAYVGL